MRRAATRTSLVHSMISRYPADAAKRRHSSTSAVPSPAPRADGSTSSSRSWAVSSSLRVGGLRVVGDDPGDEALELRVPAVLLGVALAVPLHHPAEVAGAQGAQL